MRRYFFFTCITFESNMKTSVTILTLILLFSSCTKMSEQDAMKQGDAALEKKQYDEAIKFFEIVAKEYPESANAPKALFLLAGIHLNGKKDSDKAMKAYQDLYENYPKNEMAPKALFTAAFTYANQLNAYEKAKGLYKLFLERYPNHEMAASARTELENIGIDPNVVLESLRQKDSTATAKNK